MLKTETILDAGEPLRPLLKTADDWRLLAEYARAIEALVRAECVPQWISVEDGLPPNDGDVLVWHRFNKCASVDRWSVQREDPLGMGGPTIETGYEWDEHHFEEISHWAPLPAAPGITAPQGDQQ